MNDFVYEYGRKTYDGQYQWYTGRSEKQVRAYVKVSIRDSGTYGGNKNPSSKLVRRLVSQDIEEVW